MMSLSSLFGRSPFEPLVEHARKVHQCVAMVRPVAEAILAGQMDRLIELQRDISRAEFEADQIKDRVRERLPHRYYLPVRREDVARFLAQMDKIADGAEDFAIIATFRLIGIPAELHEEFLALVDKVVAVSGLLLAVAEKVAELQKEAFSGPESDEVLGKIGEVCHMEWESDKLNRKLARHAYALPNIDAVTLLLLDKLCRELGKIADHAENVGKNLRLMINRK